MIYNDICPYCGVPLEKSENMPNSRAVEHLIANAAITIARKNDEGDFYSCRKCNSKKSHVDRLLGKIGKIQSADERLAAETLIGAITSDSKSSKRFIDMATRAQEYINHVELDVPIDAEELIEYIKFLGKGQYFKEHRTPLDNDKYVMRIQYINKDRCMYIEERYRCEHNSSPFRDLERNDHSELINNGECIIYSKNNFYLFFFHDYTAIMINVLENTEENRKLAYKSEEYIIKHFNFSHNNELHGIVRNCRVPYKL